MQCFQTINYIIVVISENFLVFLLILSFNLKSIFPNTSQKIISETEKPNEFVVFLSVHTESDESVIFFTATTTQKIFETSSSFYVK